MSDQDERPRVKLVFERESVVVAIRNLVPLRTLRPGTKETKKYSQIVRSIRAIGLVQPPVVSPARRSSDLLFVVDGLMPVHRAEGLAVIQGELITRIAGGSAL